MMTPDRQTVQLVFHYFVRSYIDSQRPPFDRCTLEEAVQRAVDDRSPEIFDLPEGEYGSVITFGWYGHFALDPTSHFARRVRNLDKFGYYVRTPDDV